MRKTEPRRRDAARTRTAILVSARKTFARHGYDGAGVREIAEGAGVTAMLVNRYFGSKEKLFAEVSADVMSTPTILSAKILSSPKRGADMAEALVALTAPDAVPLDGFQIMLRSAASERAAEIGRVEIEKRYHKILARALKGRHAAERAAVVFALVAGFQVMRQMIGLEALAKAKPAALRAVLGPLFDELVGAD